MLPGGVPTEMIVREAKKSAQPLEPRSMGRVSRAALEEVGLLRSRTPEGELRQRRQVPNAGGTRRGGGLSAAGRRTIEKDIAPLPLHSGRECVSRKRGKFEHLQTRCYAMLRVCEPRGISAASGLGRHADDRLHVADRQRARYVSGERCFCWLRPVWPSEAGVRAG